MNRAGKIIAIGGGGFTHGLDPSLDEFCLDFVSAQPNVGFVGLASLKVEEKIDALKYRISRYTRCGEKDFEGIFLADNPSFNLRQNHRFEHPTNCKEMYIKQNNQEFIFQQVKL